MAHITAKTPELETSEDIQRKKEAAMGQDPAKKRGRQIRYKAKVNDSCDGVRDKQTKAVGFELTVKAGPDMAQHLSTK